MYILFGIAGLLLITAGVLVRKRREEDALYFFGGLFLLAYSIAIRDWVFIALQVVFTSAAGWDYFRLGAKNKKKKERNL